MNEVYEAALEVRRLFDRQGWQHCVIGGLAVIRWGNPRTTRDADFSLLTGYGDEKEFVDVLADAFRGREPNENEFALRARVYRGLATNGADIDIGLAALPFEIRMMERASEYEFLEDCRLVTCSVEDLIVMKSFAGRNQDWADVTNVGVCQWKSLDWSLIDSELEEVCEMAENFDAPPKLYALRQELKNDLG